MTQPTPSPLNGLSTSDEASENGRPTDVPAVAATRIRRGKVVVIPAEWRGQLPTQQTQRKRKAIAQQKRTDRRARLRTEARIEQSFQEPGSSD